MIRSTPNGRRLAPGGATDGESAPADGGDGTSLGDRLRSTVARLAGTESDEPTPDERAGSAEQTTDGRTDPVDETPPVEAGPRDRIRQLLVDAGGKMDQADLVRQTSWAGSTISRNLSQMESDGLVERYPVGARKRVVLASGGGR